MVEFYPAECGTARCGYSYCGVLAYPAYDISVNGVSLTNKPLAISTESSMTALSGSFSFTLPNPTGALNNAFDYGDDIAISLSDPQRTCSLTVFRGYVDRIENNKDGKLATITIGGMDYTAYLQKKNAYDEYTTKEVSVIITDSTTGLMRYFPEIATTNVDVTTTTLDYVKFFEKSVYDCIKTLATQTGYNFWVDTDKVLNFKENDYASTGKTYAVGSNILGYKFEYDGKKVYNIVKVYGATDETASYVENKIGDGATTSFVLAKGIKQNSMVATVGGSAKTENTDYSIDYTAHTITFNTAPPPSAAVVLTYTALTRVVYVAQQPPSVTGVNSELIITDDNIKTVQRAKEVAELNLQLYGDIRTVGTITIRCDPTLTLGKTVNVTIPTYGITAVDYAITEIKHNYGIGGFTTTLSLLSSQINSLPEAIKTLQATIDDLRTSEYSDGTGAVYASAMVEKASQIATYSLSTAQATSAFILGLATIGTTPLGGTINKYIYNSGGTG